MALRSEWGMMGGGGFVADSAKVFEEEEGFLFFSFSSSIRFACEIARSACEKIAFRNLALGKCQIYP